MFGMICVTYLQSSVYEWLTLLRLSEYTSSLERQGYSDIDSITDITWEDLEDVGITKLGKDLILLHLLNFLHLNICILICINL